MDRHYVVADVFTDTAFGGNPLAVFLDGGGLETRQMQAIAREMNLSETTFVTPGSAPGRFRVRIFTPANELPFAGHPTIGTAVVLAETGAAAGLAEVVLEENVGPVRVALRPAGATLYIEGAPERRRVDVAEADIAAALGLPASTIAAPPWIAGYGVFFVCIPLCDVAAVSAARPRADRWEATGLAPAEPFAFTVTAEHADGAEVRARMFGLSQNIPEDPATGSAAAALAGSFPIDDALGHFRMRIAQGIEMGRPSRIETETRRAGGKVAGVSVAGGAVIVAEGRLKRLP